uniref:Uncharacterized protein n=1 Tax=Arundo donax TaxID=35708 RepID=A0A0A9BNW7_ARUDO
MDYIHPRANNPNLIITFDFFERFQTVSITCLHCISKT